MNITFKTSVHEHPFKHTENKEIAAPLDKIIRANNKLTDTLIGGAAHTTLMGHNLILILKELKHRTVTLSLRFLLHVILCILHLSINQT